MAQLEIRLLGAPTVLVDGEPVAGPKGAKPWGLLAYLASTRRAHPRAELAELKEILQPLLDRLPKPFKPQEVSIEGSPVRGNAKARVTIVEFSDLQCPFCVKHYKETFPRLVKEFVDAGKLRYVFREFPLTSIHPQAKSACGCGESFSV